MFTVLRLSTFLLLTALVFGGVIDINLEPRAVTTTSCPGYIASNVKTAGNTITADLKLGGQACNVYGTDISQLKLLVEYQTSKRLHIKIYDAALQVYQVPASVLPRPSSAQSPFKLASQDLAFNFVKNPFSFSIIRRSTGEVLFDTAGYPIIFESQYLGLRTQLPNNPNLYGLGESTDPFRLNTSNYVRTLWSRDAYTIPTGSNLYGNHPVYFDHRGANGTHAVFLLNSNGMDIKINNTEGVNQYLEYNTLGGVFDFYIVSGPSPKDVARQYADVVGHAVLMPYWGLGFHQCRYGMQDVYEVAGVIANYSAANIPLETMWTDIDYMDFRRVFTLDPLRFPLRLVKQLVNYLNNHNQHYVVMVDPAVAYYNYDAFNNGVASGAFLKNSSGGIYQGVVWPGVTAFPDWFAPATQGYWNSEFYNFFNPSTGVDIDALWIDMNEASNFCPYPCTNPVQYALNVGDPPRPPPLRLASPYAIPGFPKAFQPKCLAYVNFNVLAYTYYGENIALFGEAAPIGGGVVSGAPIMSPNTYPIWKATVNFPINTNITYTYVRLEEGGGYIYENFTRSIFTGGCGSYKDVDDTISTPQGIPPTKRGIDIPLAKPSAENSAEIEKRQSGSMLGLPGRDLLTPLYHIANTNGPISANTINTSIVHYNGLVEYDTHNLYGTMMSAASRDAMLNRRPTVRPMVITRSTFAGAGRQVGHWLGDNVSSWEQYRISIAELLEFAALFQIPMVGSDVCGYAGNTNEWLCARWAMLGAFSPFYRNHDASGVIAQEFYLWPLVTAAAQKAIAVRYQLLDYIYTALYTQTITGEPLVNPMFFAYPNDTNTFGLQLQYFYGNSILVAPVTDDNATSVTFYMPNDMFYDFWTHQPVTGTGSMVTLPEVDFTSIPLYYKGGSIVPLRMKSAMTTTDLREENFNLIIAPDFKGTATGTLYLDEGNNIAQPATSFINYSYANGVFTMTGTFGYSAGVIVQQITLLGVNGAQVSSAVGTPVHNTAAKSLTYSTNLALTQAASLRLL